MSINIPIQISIDCGPVHFNHLGNPGLTMSNLLQRINLVIFFPDKLSVGSYRRLIKLAVMKPMLSQLTSSSTALVTLISLNYTEKGCQGEESLTAFQGQVGFSRL